MVVVGSVVMVVWFVVVWLGGDLLRRHIAFVHSDVTGRGRAVEHPVVRLHCFVLFSFCLEGFSDSVDCVFIPGEETVLEVFLKVLPGDLIARVFAIAVSAGDAVLF